MDPNSPIAAILDLLAGSVPVWVLLVCPMPRKQRRRACDYADFRVAHSANGISAEAPFRITPGCASS
jgi:hypothetical protein